MPALLTYFCAIFYRTIHILHFYSINIIVPCYNPPEGWEMAMAQKFNKFVAFLGEFPAKIGLVIVNDGSVRNFSEKNIATLCRLLPHAEVVNYSENRGKGYALRQGVSRSSADFHIVTDADFPYTFESMQALVAMLIEKGGVVAGNRDTAYYEKVPLARKILSQSLRWLLRNVIRLPVTDSQCGLKGFDNGGRAIFLSTTIDRFLFDLEFLMLAGRSPIQVSPCPVTLREGVVFSKVGWKILATESLNFLNLFLRRF